MLIALNVKDFAIITSSSLELQHGLTTLTGETGAGKSILLGALGLVLGDRASPAAVRDGAQRAEISALFDITGVTDACAWLADHSMDQNDEQEDECILRRVVSKDGKSRAFINGTPVTLRNLKELGRLLVNIHGQHDHQLITAPDKQRDILDDFGECQKLTDNVKHTWQEWNETHRLISTAKERLQARGDRLDTLRYQLQEFEKLSLDTLNLDAIGLEHTRLANATELSDLCNRAMELLQDDPKAVLTQLTSAEKSVTELLTHDKTTSEVAELISSARIQLEEAVDALRQYSRGVEPQPERLKEVDDILSSAHQLAKKHQVDVDQLTSLSNRLIKESDELESMDESIESLNTDLENLTEKYNASAKKLSAKRRKAAAQLETHLSKAMQTLGMKGGKFAIECNNKTSNTPSINGNDNVLFNVSANPGAAPRPMSDVASGGELSRLSLAVQLITSERNRVPTLIFDEVDTGIGGGVAETVGQQLRNLGSRCQVLCVTHLPQVAAQGHQHVKVSKQSSDNKTLAESRTLTEKESLEEIARMLGGVKITKRTLAHAKEMLATIED